MKIIKTFEIIGYAEIRGLLLGSVLNSRTGENGLINLDGLDLLENLKTVTLVFDSHRLARRKGVFVIGPDDLLIAGLWKHEDVIHSLVPTYSSITITRTKLELVASNGSHLHLDLSRRKYAEAKSLPPGSVFTCVLK